VALACETCGTPISVVTLVDETRQWFKAERGLGIRQTDRDVSICARAMLEPGIFVIPDTTLDPRFSSNPFVTGAPRLRFYAGATLESEDGLPLGMLCVLDYQPRPGLTDSQKRVLQVLARQVMTQMELRRALIGQRKSDDRYRAAVAAMEGVIWTNDASGKMRGEQPGWAALTGQTQPEYQDYGWSAAIHPEDAQPTIDAWEQAVAARRPFIFEHRVRHVDGSWKLFSVRAIPAFETNGTIREWVGVHTDITTARANELQLLKLNQSLEGTVRERTAELQHNEEALRQAQKMEAIGQLTGGIAHDFNNLLQAIGGSVAVSQKLLTMGRTAEIDKFLVSATGSIKRAAALTHRLLAFSRRQPLNPRPVSPNQLLTATSDLFRRTLGESIELEMQLAAGLWLTRCDPNQLENAILNLVINARDAMPDGGALTISTRNASFDDLYAAAHAEIGPGEYASVAISDTGVGMSPDVVARAFDPFFTTKPIGQGTGLGLSMIYGFARQSKGHVLIQSEPGKGTTVEIFLPRFHGALDAPVDVDHLQHPAASSTATILVIEDEPDVRNLIVEYLGELGYRTLSAYDGTSALEILGSTESLDLLLTDVGLPGLNGRQIADAARETRPTLKVLFMTGYAENAALNQGFLAEGMQILAKPFAMEVLSNKVAQLLR
jgi:PAS domain S-box-containing protein